MIILILSEKMTHWDKTSQHEKGDHGKDRKYATEGQMSQYGKGAARNEQNVTIQVQ